MKGVNQYSTDKFDFAGGYKVQRIEIFPHDSLNITRGQGIDISNLVTNVTIEENITSMALKATFTLVDGVNIIQQLALSGNERIIFSVRRKDPYDNLSSITLLFYVVEYPIYGKSDTKSHQAYKIVCTTEHGFINPLMTTGKVYKGSPYDVIKKILTTDLVVDTKKVNVSPYKSGDIHYVAPSKNPLSCIRDIITMVGDREKLPIFVYETLTGIRVESLKDIHTRESLNGFIYKLNSMPITPKNPAERFFNEATSILSFSSNLRLSNIQKAIGGAYAMTLSRYNMADKEYEEKVVRISDKEEQHLLSKHSAYSPLFRVNNKALKDYPTACNFHSTTTKSNEKQLDKDLFKISPVKESLLAKQENITHDMQIYGDLSFSAGSVITIETYNTRIQNNETVTEKDEYFSGRYMVVAVTHTFADDYRMDVKIVKDGFDVSLFR